MRQITEFTSMPEATETIVIGGRTSVFVRTDITSEEVDGETRYKAVEYSTQVNANGFELTQDFIDALIADETTKAAAAVRAIRNKLLADSDKEILPDRLNKSSSAFKAWSDYREQLRDIPEQEGFPFNVIFPDKPE